MTGSLAQLINAVFLLGAYVCVRLIFGVYNVGTEESFSALSSTDSLANSSLQSISWFSFCNFPSTPHYPPIPTYIRLFYSIGNVTLNSLNFVWFRSMIRAVLKRFDTKPINKEKLDPRKIANGEHRVDAFQVKGTGDEEFEEEAGVRRRAVQR